jgi:hypothetical protein
VDGVGHCREPFRWVDVYDSHAACAAGEKHPCRTRRCGGPMSP